MQRPHKDARAETPGSPRAPSAWEITTSGIDGRTRPDAQEEVEAEEFPQAPAGPDAEAGMSGYSGEAVTEGLEEAGGRPTRPLDAEIHGDPRTHEGEGYPEDEKRVDPDQRPIGATAAGDLAQDEREHPPSPGPDRHPPRPKSVPAAKRGTRGKTRHSG